jgi:hypothetical protein
MAMRISEETTNFRHIPGITQPQEYSDKSVLSRPVPINRDPPRQGGIYTVINSRDLDNCKDP